MFKAGGNALWTEPGKPDIERDTITCCHCNRITIIQPYENVSDRFCAMCNRYMCNKCTDRRVFEGCQPFEKKLEEMESRARFRRSLG